jgi:tetratricopeptide (TPR) repeat protein
MIAAARLDFGRCHSPRLPGRVWQPATGTVSLVVLLLLSSLLLIGAPAGAQDTAREFDTLVAQAVQLHEAGDILGAIDGYTAALKLQPNHPGVRSNLGAAYVRLGKYEEAIEQYRAALRLDAANQAARFNLGLAYYKAARLPDAISTFEAVLAADPANAKAVVLLADALLQSGKFQQVIEVLTPRETQFASDLAFGYVLGMALLRTGQHERAQVYLDRIFKAGESAEAHLLMGTALIETRDYPGAVVELRKAVELNPDLPTVRTVYARALLGNGDHDGAVRELQRAVSANPNDFEANLQLGALLRRDERHQESLTYLRRATELRPQDPAARFGLGAALLSQGQLEDARRLLEAVVVDVPDYTEAHVMLATCYYRLKRSEDAERHRAIAERLRAEQQERPRKSGGSGPGGSEH